MTTFYHFDVFGEALIIELSDIMNYFKNLEMA